MGTKNVDSLFLLFFVETRQGPDCSGSVGLSWRNWLQNPIRWHPWLSLVNSEELIWVGLSQRNILDSCGFRLLAEPLLLVLSPHPLGPVAFSSTHT